MFTSKYPISSDTLLIPACVASVSAVLLILQTCYLIASRSFRSQRSEEDEWSRVDVDEQPDVSVSAHISSHGGTRIFIFRLARLAGCLVLLGLSLATLILDDGNELEDEMYFGYDNQGRMGLIQYLSKWDKKRKHPIQRFTENEWLQSAICMTFMYISLLSLLCVTTKPPQRQPKSTLESLTAWLPTHLTSLLLVTFAVYAWRDLYPLCTFSLSPVDLPMFHTQGRAILLWTKIAILFVTAIVIPLVTPRVYIPVDARYPSENPAPEQNCSLMSLAIYSFLDPTILLAYRVPHLSYDQLPPLADYDEAKNLKARSFPYLDPLDISRDKKRRRSRHLFWGFMSTFRQEYTIMAFLVVLRALTTFLAPVGVNRLLHYMESNGRDAYIRPWVWVLWLFCGPMVDSIENQLYVFISSHNFVCIEAIITQLVFEHALRIRVKAETDSTTKEPNTAVSSGAPTSSGSGSSTLATPQSELDNSGYDERDQSTSSTPNSQETAASSSSSVVTGDSLSGKSLVGTLKAKIRSRLFSRDDSTKKPDKSSKPDKRQKKEAENPRARSDGKNLNGKLNNLVSTDLANIGGAKDFLLLLLYAPLQIALGITFLYFVLGWSAFVGLGVMIIFIPLPGNVSKLMQNVQRQRMKHTDARVQRVTETMNVIRMIKLFGWERKMDERISDARETELVWLRKKQLVVAINGCVNFLIPVAIMLATFTTYAVVMKRELNASIVFSSMSVFDMLRDQLHTAIWTVSRCVQGKVSLDRVNDFLHNTELLDYFVEQQNDTNDTTSTFTHSLSELAAGTLPTTVIEEPPATLHPLRQHEIGFCNATFTWGSDVVADDAMIPSKRKFILKIDKELLFRRNSINLIVGPTGSGKTSMLMALLGEMHFIPSGLNSWYNLPRESGIAYAAQESWVQNETIRENILFGAALDEERYRKVLYQCCLERDLQLFEAGDNTEVGEKGLTLSGGQKARITLARAVYSRAEIILLDDVLSALDVHTGKWIVDKCFRGDLIQNRTIILVSHNVALATPIADMIVSLGPDGQVISRGIVPDVIAHDQELAKEIVSEADLLGKAEEVIDSAVPAAEETKKPEGKLIAAEEIEIGRVGWDALKMYLVSVSDQHPILFYLAFIGGVFLSETIFAFLTWFLGLWASQYESHPASEVSVSFYLTAYACLSMLGWVVFAVAFMIYVHGIVRASRRIHRQLIESILGTTLRWLDTTPMSRIITRCTQDISVVDDTVSLYIEILTETFLSMLIKVGAVVFFTPIFLGPSIFIALLGGWIGQLYMAAQLPAKREMSNAKSPILGHIGAAITGLTSIRAYGAQEAFKKESLRRIDKYTRAARTFWNLNRWVCIRIDALANGFTFALATYLLYGRQQGASNTGFTLNMAIGFSSMILWCVRMVNEFEVQANSLERIKGYMHIEQEPKPTEDGKPPAYWPASGDLRVENLSARYSPDGPKVLEGISFHIQSGERVGVVGRTGSGKSSLTLSLLRCIYTDGAVYLDGIPTASINLDALRSTITIIPQVPELLSGTLRHNLDPFSQFDDATLNNALRAAGLFSLQTDDDEDRITLDTEISSGGGNLSVGQRQILALARAILRGSKLLILDEATSAIDYKTDSVIQSSLRNELGRDVTLITVAHRLQTIMDADKIMVLDAGKIVEFDTPHRLLQKANGKFRSLIDESEDRDRLIAMASST